jgi:hypothetical protein
MSVSRVMIATLMVAAGGMAAAPAQAEVVYQQAFSGQGAPLHGQAPTINNTGAAAAWVTRTDTGELDGIGRIFFDNGTINAAGAVNGSATLPFAPAQGFIYTLTASFGPVAADANNWIGLGFAGGQSSVSGNPGRFLADPTSGQPWMIYRGNNATSGNQTFLGPGTTDGFSWLTPVTAAHGDPVDLRIVLDTTGASWSAQWFAKRPGDADFTSIGAATYTTNPSIAAVGVAAAHASVVSSISAFELTVIPEPSTALLLGITAITLLRRRL